MIRFFRDLRLIPIALIASACLLALKTAEIVLDGGYLMSDAAPVSAGDPALVRATPDAPQGPQRSWAQQMFNFPGATGGGTTPTAAPPPIHTAALTADKLNGDVTGSVASRRDRDNGGASDDVVGALKSEPKGAGSDAKSGKPPAGAATADIAPPSGAERAILEHLQERRQELDKRGRELDIREGLLQAAEKRMEAKLGELKQIQAQIASATEKKGKEEAARFKGLVTMYETMKPRDAAKIFDRLEIGVLLEVASQISPRSMADILAQMAPDKAERLTVELATRASANDKGTGGLPKIEGRPTTP